MTSPNYNQFATQSDDISPIGGGYWKGSYPSKMRHFYDIKHGDGPFPTDYEFQPSEPVITVPNTDNSVNYRRGAKWNNQNGNITTVGTNGKPSYYGTYDQSGNVFEWVLSNRNTPENKYILRGGSCLSRGPKKISNRIRYINSDSRIVHPLNDIGFRVASKTNLHRFSNFSLVSDPSNEPDPFHINQFNHSLGSVDYNYYIGKFNITNIEYIEFLESVASREDTHGLFNQNISNHAFSGIIQIPGSNHYRYSLKSSAYKNKPVVGIDWPQAVRFCNWLHHNKPRGFQDEKTTEDGAYSINGNFSNTASLIENKGNTILGIDENNNLTANGVSIKYQNDSPVYAFHSSWKFIAAENIDNTNYLVSQYSNGVIALWEMSAEWKVISVNALLFPDNSNSFNGKTFSDFEQDFGMSFALSDHITANENALYYIPTEDEWYKAAFYNPGSKTYNLFATRSNTNPIKIESSYTGDGPFLSTYVFNYEPILPHPLDPEDEEDGPDIIFSANYNSGAKWDNKNRNLTTVGTNGPPSLYGTYDQSGNVKEFVHPQGQYFGIFRGGSYASTPGPIDEQRPYNGGYVCSYWDREMVHIRNCFGGFRLVTLADIGIDSFVEIAHPGNPGDVERGGYGAVNYIYYINKYPVTVCEYLEFLNAVATKNDNKELYNRNMNIFSKIRQIRSSVKGYRFEYVLTNDAYLNKPIDYVSCESAARYCNWLFNHKPTTGYANDDTTENGPMNISYWGLSRNTSIIDGFFIPTENEWYKAAFYDFNSYNNDITGYVYVKYATGSDTIPVPVYALPNGDGTLDNQNSLPTTFTCNNI